MTLMESLYGMLRRRSREPPWSKQKYKQRRRYFGQIIKGLEVSSFTSRLAASLLHSAICWSENSYGYAPLWNAAIWESLFRPCQIQTRRRFSILG
jgi:hypothetical protein